MESSKEKDRNSGAQHRRAAGGRPGRVWQAALVMLLFTGCVPAIYSVDMNYTPTGAMRSFAKVDQPVPITVAAFVDARKVDDKMQIGRVVKSNDIVVPILPRFMNPSQAVTAPFKEFFRRAGYRVSADSPLWDLKEESIRKEWGTILIGGSIDELEVLCRESVTIKKYTAKVKLTVLFADARSGKIFYKVTTGSSSSLDHLLFSEAKLEEQINSALSDAIEKIFEGKELAEIIRKAAKQ